MYAFLVLIYAVIMSYALTQILRERIPYGWGPCVGFIIFLFIIKFF